MSGRTGARFSLALRIAAGTLGAYGVTALVTVAASRLLIRCSIDAVEAVTGVALASFALFAAVSMTVFHARSLGRTCAALLALSVACTAMIFLLGFAS